MILIRSKILYRVQAIVDANEIKELISKSKEEDIVVINAPSLTSQGMRIFKYWYYRHERSCFSTSGC
jgi:hypothetical protein